MISPRNSSSSSRRVRSQRGITCPTYQPEVLSGRDRIDQLSTPRYRATDSSDYKAPQQNGFGYCGRTAHDAEQISFEATEKAFRRAKEHPSGLEAQQKAIDDQKHGRGTTFPPVPKLPSACHLLNQLQHSLDQKRGQTRLASTKEHEAFGIAGLTLAETGNREDSAAIHGGTKLQIHELTNTEVPRAEVDSARFPIVAVVSGRRRVSATTGNGTNLKAPEPSAVRSLAISGIDTSRIGENNRPTVPSYFHAEVRTTRNGTCKYPDTLGMSQPERYSGQYSTAAEQFDANTRGMHNASTYVLADKLRVKAQREVRISKYHCSDGAMLARAQSEIDKKNARRDRRVQSLKQQRLNWEERVQAGL